MAARLPFDLWAHVATFLHAGCLRRVAQRFAELPRGVKVDRQGPGYELRNGLDQWNMGDVQTLVLQPVAATDSLLMSLCARGAPVRLLSLTVDLSRAYVTSDGMEALGTFCGRSPLRHLALHVGHIHLPPRVIQILFRLPTLREFALEVPEAQYLIGHNPACEILARNLPPTCPIHTFALRAPGNHMDNWPARALATLGGWQSLRSLTVDLSGGCLGPEGCALLGRLAQCPTLRHLDLDLACAFVYDEGARHLTALVVQSRLTSLTLGLVACGIGPAGAAALSELGTAEGLTRLNLDLAHNQLGDAGVRALQPLRLASGLTHLTLNVAHTGVGDDGADAIAQVRSLPPLRTVHLSLRGNPVTDVGAWTLATLRLALPPRHCALSLLNTHVTPEGKRAFAGWPAGAALLDPTPAS